MERFDPKLIPACSAGWCLCSASQSLKCLRWSCFLDLTNSCCSVIVAAGAYSAIPPLMVRCPPPILLNGHLVPQVSRCLENMAKSRNYVLSPFSYTFPNCIQAHIYFDILAWWWKICSRYCWRSMSFDLMIPSWAALWSSRSRWGPQAPWILLFRDRAIRDKIISDTE